MKKKTKTILKESIIAFFASIILPLANQHLTEPYPGEDPVAHFVGNYCILVLMCLLISIFVIWARNHDRNEDYYD